MFTPIKTDNYIVLNGKKFRVYKLDNFSFDESLDITNEKGLYCFTKRLILSKEQLIFHTLLYLGKADGENGINGRLTTNHNQFKNLKGESDCLCLYLCGENEDVKSIESEMLTLFPFKLNTQENEKDGYFIVREVSVNNQP